MMRFKALALLLSLLAMAGPVAAQPAEVRPVRDAKVGQRAGEVGGFPNGWGGGTARPQDYEFGTAPVEGATGKQAAFIRARPGAATNAYFIMLQCIKADNYLGKRVRLSSRLKSDDTSGAQLMMRVDGSPLGNGQLPRVLNFYNMGDRPIKGTTDWKRQYIVLDVPQDAVSICFGFILVGGVGEVWADDFSLDPVGREVPLSQVPPKAPVNLSFDR